MSRLLALVTDAFGGRGGIAQSTRDLVGCVAESGMFVSLHVLPRHCPDPAIDVPLNVHQHTAVAHRLNYSFKAILTALRLRPDYVFCNHLYMAPLARIVARIVGAQLIIQLHGVEIWSEPSRVRRKALEDADLIICVSRDTRARALTYCDLQCERVVVLNNTVDSRFAPGNRAIARAKFGLADQFVLLIVSRLDPNETYKGHERVFEALNYLLKCEVRSFELLVAGDGSDRARLENVAGKLNVSNYIRFLGQVPATDLPDLYRAADLFVLPSTGEGFGIVFLEAMACGTPAIGLSAGGVPDALANGELGVLAQLNEDFSCVLHQSVIAKNGDPNDLASAVQARFGRVAFGKRLAMILGLLQ